MCHKKKETNAIKKRIASMMESQLNLGKNVETSKDKEMSTSCFDFEHVEHSMGSENELNQEANDGTFGLIKGVIDSMSGENPTTIEIDTNSKKILFENYYQTDKIDCH